VLRTACCSPRVCCAAAQCSEYTGDDACGSNDCAGNLCTVDLVTEASNTACTDSGGYCVGTAAGDCVECTAGEARALSA
jgi:hypothetical protein